MTRARRRIGHDGSGYTTPAVAWGRFFPERRGPAFGPGASASLPTLPNPRGPPLILLPTLNEERGLRVTLEELASVPEYANSRAPDVLVVDGRSTDGTRDVAQAYCTRFISQRGRGKGGAVREGLEWAVENGYGSVAVLDADGTYPCDRLPTMIGLLQSDADVVAGVRRPVMPPRDRGRFLVHRIGNGLLNFCAAQLSGGPILDVCSGFWGVRVSALPVLDLQSNGFEVESELFVKTMRRELRMVQIPVEYRPRVGEAKLHAVRDGARILLSILRHSATTPTERGAWADVGPAHRAPVRSPSVAPIARDLTTLLLTLQVPTVIVLSGSTRYSEAVEVARTVERCRPTVQVSAQILGADRAGSPGPVSPSGEAPPSPGASPVVVTLPDPIGNGDRPGSALVSVPSAGRTLLLEDREALPVGSAPLRSRFTRSRRAGGGQAPSPFVVLGAMLDASGLQKELALVAANASGGRWQVSRIFRGPRRGSAPADDAASPIESTPASARVTGSM